jgi:MFS family permease
MKLVADDVQSVIIPGSGHWVAEEAPDQLLACSDHPFRGAVPHLVAIKGDAVVFETAHGPPERRGRSLTRAPGYCSEMRQASQTASIDSDPQPASLWQPLRTPIFRNLFIADLLSDMGTFMQSVGAAWLMVSLGASATFVALTQTASSLPFFLFALPAGAIGDIVDRRKLILYCQYWMVGVATVLAIATIAGLMSPWLLLALTFALSAGDAIETPTWRALLPELVGKKDLAAASALNGIEFNFARAVGPALAGALIAAAGVGAAFVVNVISFVGVIIVVRRWKRPERKRSAPLETLGGATIAAVRYVRHSPVLRLVMLRAGATMFAASALLALLPSVARTISARPTVFGVLLGCFGTGAVLGGLAMQPARRRWSLETVATSAVVMLGAMIIAAGAVSSLVFLAAVVLVAGAGWLVFISLTSALVQTLAPDWARARVLAVFILIFQGGIATGSAAWGAVATRTGIPTALLFAGLATIATIALRGIAKLPDATADMTPWNHWRMPAIHEEASALEHGPVLVTVRYRVQSQHADAFLRAMQKYGQIRRRDGASWWGVFHDLEKADVYLETFLVTSWAEHVRQHDRFTRGDRDVEAQIREHVEEEPAVEHFIRADVNS